MLKISLAIILRLSEVDQPGCLCQGKVIIDGESYDHSWCRVGNTIFDAAADQFSDSEEVMIAEKLIFLIIKRIVFCTPLSPYSLHQEC